MIKRLLIGLGALVALALVVIVGGLAWAKVAIRRERPPLPSREALAAAAQVDQLPVRLSFINTASQAMPRAAVLEPKSDPHPAAPYVMSHPAFVIEWADGRILLVDLGMDRDDALFYGRITEMVSRGAPVEPHGAVVEHLGNALQRVQGIVFTHLHVDHVSGITSLCSRVQHPLRVLMTQAQDERPNFTTRPSQHLLRDAPCVRREVLRGGPLLSLPGFAGVYVVDAGGHTPGSQMIVVFVRTDNGVQKYILAGDIANNIDGINANVPKPLLYRWLIVPEDDQRLAELRQYLRGLRDDEGFTVLVSHDQLALEQSGVPTWENMPVNGSRRTQDVPAPKGGKYGS